jgi:fatty-acyl-CoA synthase
MITERKNAGHAPKSMPLAVEGWTFGRFIDEIAAGFGELPAIAASDRTYAGPGLRRWTYAEMTRDVHALQWGLLEAGVKPGERVAVMLTSVPEWVLYLFAVTRLGAVFVPINTRFRSRELHHVLTHSGGCAFVAMARYLGHDYAAMVDEICGARGSDGRYTNVPELRTLIGVRESAGKLHRDALSTDELLSSGHALLKVRGAPPATQDPEENALLFYTSGTTSFPKGVPLTHANLLPHLVKAGGLIELKPGENVLNLYPFFGISGGANKVLSTFGSGACLVFQDAFRADDACDLLETERCSVIHGVDVHIREMVAAQARRGGGRQPDRRATIAFTGGTDEALAQAMGLALGVHRFVHPYGMTETNPMILRNELDDPFDVSVRAGGRIAPAVEVRVVDPDSDADKPVGEEGEIVVRGPTVMRGYYNDPEATAAAFRNGWFHSGDLGVRTGEGFVFYVGRLKDMLKVGGFNVAPQEIESLLRTHEAVEDVAVTGMADARLGEVPVAFVTAKAAARATPEAIIAWCRERVANFKVPRAVHFVEALPYHTAAHGAKLQRHVLHDWARERAAGNSN